MSNEPLPFVGFIGLGQLPEATRDELLAKMLRGELPTYVYSSDANGKLDPVLITPAEFFRAWRSAQVEDELEDEERLDRNGWRLAKMEPFQIRVSDEDKRRDPRRLSRIKIGVPHWIYVAKADLPEHQEDPGTAELRKATKSRIRDEIDAAYADAAAQETKPPNVAQIRPIVRDRLRKAGFRATGTSIEEIAGEPQFQKLRGPVGVTLANKRK